MDVNDLRAGKGGGRGDGIMEKIECEIAFAPTDKIENSKRIHVNVNVTC